jgi:hypothetical protein
MPSDLDRDGTSESYAGSWNTLAKAVLTSHSSIGATRSWELAVQWKRLPMALGPHFNL